RPAVPAYARGNGMWLLNTVYYTFTTLMAVLLYLLVRGEVLTPAGQLWFLAVLAAVGTAAAWWWLVRDSVEQLTEILLAANYRIHLHGPGVGKVPTSGPLLVLANHACWMDPLLLAKVLPRWIFPMMTALFFDLPVLRWLMVHLFHAIRVPAVAFRREAPELQEAIAL